MTQKTVIARVYGKDYALACDVGQEPHLNSLVADFNQRTVELEKAVGRLPESLMLLYTALMVNDELHDTARELKRAREDVARLKEELATTQRQLEQTQQEVASDTRFAALEEEVAQNLFAVAKRMEGLAEKLAA